MTLKWYGDKIISNINNAKRGGLTAAALIVEGDAVLHAAVDTGNLRSSITHQLMSDEEARVGTNVEYAPYVEYGTHKMDAQPYLRPALDNNEARIRELIFDVIRKAVDRGGK